MRGAQAGERGSVFIEVMVSAAILALALGMTFRAIGETAARQRMIEARRGAMLVARSELAATGSAIPLQFGETRGLSGPFAWRVAAEPYGADQAASSAGNLMRITVDVSAREGGPPLATLSTLRLAPAS